MDRRSLDQRVTAVRRFNRFYTKKIGVLGEKLLESQFSLAEVRVLYELAQRESPTASELAEDLGIDPGYLSRILSRFESGRILRKEPSEADGRQHLLQLTERGREVFKPLDARACDEIRGMLDPLSEPEQNSLVQAMATIERLIGESLERERSSSPPSRERDRSYLLRPPRAGYYGWVVHRHGVLYAEEYGWDERFEALVAGIVAKFVQEYDPRRDRCWIAEREGWNVGSVFLVKHSAEVAQLRLLLVEPAARGLGIGRRLVQECVRFARGAGYRTMTLWTNDVLLSARRIYEAEGFRLTREEPHHSFGKDLVGQTWEVAL